VNAVSIRGLGWKYSGRKTFAIDGVDLEIPANTFVSVVGPNEHGKTTLVSCIKGIIPHSFHGVWRGTVEVFGEDIRKLSGQRLAELAGFVFADPEAQFTSMTVEEELAFGLENIGLPLDEISRRLEWVSGLTGINGLWDKSPFEISGGQKQRVAIARALHKDAPILVLDEATSSLDTKAERQVQAGLDELMTGRTTLIIAHRLSTISSVDRIVTLREGRVDEIGTPDELALSGGIYSELLALQASASKADRRRLAMYDIAG
jgi:ABC-type multidrug transport system fused ATPase/permease subunit